MFFRADRPPGDGLRGHEVVGVCPEYAEAVERYFGPSRGAAWVSGFPPEVEMWRIAVTPEQVRILDFETRFPSASSR
ncbi:hypothetical protein ACL02T_19745 [Pseudonocardia sp. RS010]|uniref:hypothetical protein n=1 Tax=Pseudonocardia sp. RS010 TaxID=3385979 RepID=UPI00399FCEDA